MAKEIERKFLVKEGYDFAAMAESVVDISQGYLAVTPRGLMRVRIWGDKGFITVKSKTKGLTRDEFEYEIPLADAHSMLNLCLGRIIEKRRYIIPFEGHVWEIDEFQGELAPLIVAEIELKKPSETFSLPPFIDIEVTGNKAYYNSSLASMPVKSR